MPTIPLSFEHMVPLEINETEWQCFMTLLWKAILEMAGLKLVFISDQEKGLLLAVCHVFNPIVVHCYRTWHLGDNVRTRFGKKHVKSLDGLVYTTTLDNLNGICRGSLNSIKSWANTSRILPDQSSILGSSFNEKVVYTLLLSIPFLLFPILNITKKILPSTCFPC